MPLRMDLLMCGKGLLEAKNACQTNEDVLSETSDNREQALSAGETFKCCSLLGSSGDTVTAHAKLD